MNTNILVKDPFNYHSDTTLFTILPKKVIGREGGGYLGGDLNMTGQLYLNDHLSHLGDT